MSDRMNYLLSTLQAGSCTGETTFIRAWRKSDTNAGSKKGAVIGFHKTGMSMAMLLLGILPDKLMYSIVPLSILQQSLKPFEEWPPMSDGEAQDLISRWFDGDDHHIMAGTSSQCSGMKDRGISGKF